MYVCRCVRLYKCVHRKALWMDMSPLAREPSQELCTILHPPAFFLKGTCFRVLRVWGMIFCEITEICQQKDCLEGDREGEPEISSSNFFQELFLVFC